MAVKPSTKWPAQTKAADANYTYGSAQNVTVPGDGTGTPWVADLINDFWGMGQAFLLAAGIVPSGNPDTILASDYYDAITAVAWARANHTGTQALGTITGHTKAVHDALGINAATLGGQNLAYALARANHTGTQALGTITGHDKAAHDALGIAAATALVADQVAGLIPTILNIGDWDMVATTSVGVAHGLTLSKIRIVEVMIINDAGTESHPLNFSPGAAAIAGFWKNTTTQVTISRVAGGQFDSVNYDDTPYNRGHVTIWSTP